MSKWKNWKWKSVNPYCKHKRKCKCRPWGFNDYAQYYLLLDMAKKLDDAALEDTE